MENWAEIRRLHKAEGMPIKSIARHMGIARNTVRAALPADSPPTYKRASKGSIVDAVEPDIRKLLQLEPRMPVTVIAERIGWTRSMTVLKDRVRAIRPEYVSIDPADRIVHHPGTSAQMDLWFPEPRIPVGAGQALMLPVLVMTLTFSRFLSAVMIPTRQAGDLLSGMWQLIGNVGAVSKELVWDREAAIGGSGKLTEPAAGFAGTLATKITLAPARDPEFKGMTERNNQYFETSFLPGRSFTSPEDFNLQLSTWVTGVANRRTVRSLGGRPVDHLDADLAAMTPLPPVGPATGLSNRVRLARDYYVRIGSSDYSVDPNVIGRLVDVHAVLDRVVVTCDGQVVADHRRCWAKHQTITDPVHVEIAKLLRRRFSQVKRDRAAALAYGNQPGGRPETAAHEGLGEQVAVRDTGSYHDLFGVNFHSHEPAPAMPDTPQAARTSEEVA